MNKRFLSLLACILAAVSSARALDITFTVDVVMSDLHLYDHNGVEIASNLSATIEEGEGITYTHFLFRISNSYLHRNISFGSLSGNYAGLFTGLMPAGPSISLGLGGFIFSEPQIGDEGSIPAPAQTVAGDLRVQGSIDITGNILTFGTQQPTGDPTFFWISEHFGDTTVLRSLAGQNNSALFYNWSWETPTNWSMRLENSTLRVNGPIYSAGSPVLTSSTFGGDISLFNTSDHAIKVDDSGTGAGRNLTVRAGNAASGGNSAGGTLTLSAGSSTGTQGSSIEFKTASSTSHSPISRLKINAAGGIEAGDNVSSQGGFPQLVIGKWNNIDSVGTDGFDHRTGVFVVGTGSMGQRENALRVLPDGTILIKKSGDLPMDGFESGPQP